jgi:hypothetical protein
MPDFTRLRRALNSHAAVVINLQKEVDVVARAVEAATVNYETVVTLVTSVSPACVKLITDEFGLTFSADGKTLYMGAPVSVGAARAAKRARARSPSPVNHRSEVPQQRKNSVLQTLVDDRLRTMAVSEKNDDGNNADANNNGNDDDDEDDDDDDNDVNYHGPVLLEEDVAEEKEEPSAPLDEASALVARKMALNDSKIESVTEQLDNATDSQKPFLTAELERLQEEQKALQRGLANILPRVELTLEKEPAPDVTAAPAPRAEKKKHSQEKHRPPNSSKKNK